MRGRFISRKTRRRKETMKEIAFGALFGVFLVALFFAAIIIQPHIKALFY